MPEYLVAALPGEHKCKKAIYIGTKKKNKNSDLTYKFPYSNTSKIMFCFFT